MRTLRPALWQLTALVSLGSCASTPSAWRQVDPERLMITVNGRLETLNLPAEGDVRLEVTPDPAHRYALAPGQQRLACIVPARDRGDLETVLLNLRVGLAVQVSGYWTARDEAGRTLHYINDTTDIVPND